MIIPKIAYSVIEAAKSAGISRSYLYKAWAKGQGPKTHKVGAKNLIMHVDLVAWLESLPTGLLTIADCAVPPIEAYAEDPETTGLELSPTWRQGQPEVIEIAPTEAY